MARVNVETRALAEGRFTAFQEDLKMSRWEAIGILVLFWHDSQEREVWKGVRDQVEKFVPDRSRREPIFNALLEHEYISECPDGEFAIHGNRKHIEAIASKVEAGKEGGKRSGEARRRKSNDFAETEADTCASEPITLQHSTVHHNTSQDITEQSSLLPPALAGEIAKALDSETLKVLNFHLLAQELPGHWIGKYRSPGWIVKELKMSAQWLKENPKFYPSEMDSFLESWMDRSHNNLNLAVPAGGKKQPNPLNLKSWESYSNAYFTKYGTEPVRNATVNAQIASMVKRLGADAPAVAGFFVTHADQYYTRAMHPVGLLLRDCEKIHTEWKRGVQMLGSQAREIERREHNASAFEGAFETFKAMGMKFAGT